MPILFQAGNIIGLLQCVYNGDINFKTLAHHGDIGLGTFNGVDGEMIAVDGVFYRADANGKLEIANSALFTPFSVVTHHEPSIELRLSNIQNMDELNRAIDTHLPTLNIFYMLRIHVDIEWINMRSESCQTTPYQPLAESLPRLQNTFELDNISGTLVATRCPQYAEGVTVTGYHYHFIDDTKKIGGHAFDFKIKSAIIQITSCREFKMALFDNNEFDTATLDIDTKSALKKTE